MSLRLLRPQKGLADCIQTCAKLGSVVEADSYVADKLEPCRACAVLLQLAFITFLAYSIRFAIPDQPVNGQLLV